jgi:FkbM family methyltransferase
MGLGQRVKGKAVRLWDRAQPRHDLNGAVVPLRTDNIDLLYWRPNWKTQLISSVLAARPGVFIDVGINVGQTFADYCYSAVRNGYIGFEPNARCVERTSAIIDASSFSDCTIVPVGLAEENTVISLYVDRNAPLDAGATMIPNFRPGVEVAGIHVPVFRFDDIRDGVLQNRPISLIKIDVEGGELKVLGGMTETLRTIRPLIQCEVLGRYFCDESDTHALRCRNLISLLRSADYKVLRVEKTEHEGDLAGYSEVSSFPEEIHTHENKHLCDFLFVPREVDWPLAQG